MHNYEEFRGEVRKQMSIRHWNVEDLAKAIGYGKYSVYAFMQGKRLSIALCSAIAQALEIPEYMTT